MNNVKRGVRLAYAPGIHSSCFGPLDVPGGHLPGQLLAEEAPYARVPYTCDELKRMDRFTVIVPRILSLGYMMLRCLKLDRDSLLACLHLLGDETELMAPPPKGYVMLVYPGFVSQDDAWIAERGAEVGLTTRHLTATEYLTAIMIGRDRSLGVPREPRAIHFDPEWGMEVYVVCDKYATVKFFTGTPGTHPYALGFESRAAA